MQRRALFLTILFLAVASGAFSYDNLNVHPALTEEAARIYNNNADAKLSGEQIRSLVKGAIAEDADPRYLNHFYNPQSGAGLGKGLPAKTWALDGGWGGLTGDFSEKAIIESYRAGDKQRAYEGVGHLLHVLQDMAVPAHVRLDSHPSGDSYEQWAQKNGFISASEFIKIESIGSVFDELSTYTHDNFYSKGTFSNPIKYDSVKIENDIDGVQSKYGYLNNYRLVKIQSFKENEVYYLDDLVFSDYWQQLAPKAVGYSAGVIKYFNDQFVIIDKENNLNKEISFLKTGKEMLAMVWRNTNYTLNDITGSVWTQEKIGATIDFAVSAGKTVAVYKEPLTQTLQTISSTTQKIIQKIEPKVLGVKIGSSTEKVANAIINISVPKAQAKVVVIKPGNDSGIVESPMEIDLLKSFSTEPVIIENPKNTNTPKIVNFIIPSGSGTSANDSPIELPSPPPPNPEATIIQNPNNISSSTVASFAFASSIVSSSFEVSLDGGEWAAASSSIEFSVADGEHLLKVRAFTSAGQLDPTPAEFGWVVDATAPSSTVASLPLTFSSETFLVSWSGEDLGASSSGLASYDVEYKLDANEWQSWLSATTATSAEFNLPVELGTEISFRSRAVDNFGNLEAWPTNADTKSVKAVNHLVISAVQISGVNANDEFVELYNPTEVDIDLSKYELRKKTSAAVSSTPLLINFSSAIIKSHGYFLITHPVDYQGEAIADLKYGSSGYGITADNTIILSANGVVIDKVGIGAAKDFEIKTTPGISNNQALLRKANASSTADSWQGNGYDTDNNSNDFIILNNYQPKNSFSPTEPRLLDAVLPETITNLTLLETKEGGVTLSWSSPVNANLVEGSFYELRYAVKSGNCSLNINWHTASSAPQSSLPIPSDIAGVTESATIQGLSGNEFCFALRTFNGTDYSNLSNQISAKVPLVGNTITVDNISTTTPSWSNKRIWSHTIGSTNTVLAVAVFAENYYVNTIKYAGLPMTLAKSRDHRQTSDNMVVSVYYLVNPPVGTNDIVITSSYYTPWMSAAISLSGVDNLQPIYSATTSDSYGSSFALTQNITGNKALFLSAMGIPSLPTSVLTPASGQTEFYNARMYGQTNNMLAGISYQKISLPGTSTSTWNNSEPRSGVQALVVFKAED